MSNIPVLVDGKGEKDADRSNLDDEIKSFKIVKTSLMFDILSDETSLVMVDGAVKMGLKMIHSLGVENMHIGLRRNESLGSIVT